MNVLIIAPHNPTRTPHFWMPIGPISLARVLDSAGHVPNVLDLGTVPVVDMDDSERTYVESIITRISSFQPEVVCFSCLTFMQFPVLRRCAQAVKKRWSNIPVIFGGIHPSTYFNDILRNCPEIDCIALGEGEEQIVAVANAFEKGSFGNLTAVQAIAWRDHKGEIRANPRMSYISDLDTLGRPGYEFLDFDAYKSDHSGWYNPKKLPIDMFVPIITSRSCPFNCGFCSVHEVMGRKIRFRSPKNVIDDIDFLVNEKHKHNFVFIDDNVNIDKKHFLSICNGIIKRNLNLNLYILQGIHLPSIDEESASAFVDAGGVGLSLPIESASPEIRSNVVGKSISNDKIKEIVSLFKKSNLFMIGFFIMGFEEDSCESLDAMIDLIHELKIDINVVTNLMPFPGTRIFEAAKKNNTLLYDYRDFWKGETFEATGSSRFYLKPQRLTFEQLEWYRQEFDKLRNYSARVGGNH